MQYNFDEIINRRGTASNKWDIPEGKLGMVTADMDFRTAQPILDAMEERVRHGIFGYNDRTDNYYNAVIGWMKRKHQWTIEKDWICHALGVVPAIGYSILAFTKPGDKIIIQPPVYHPFRNSIINSRRIPLTNPLILENGEYRMDFEDLEQKASDPAVKMMLLCNPQNPTGRVWSKEDLKKIADICLCHHIIVFSDEIHSDFMFHGSKFYSYGRLAEDYGEKYNSNVIIGTSASKTFNLAGLQNAAIIIANPDLRENYIKQLERFHCGDSSTFGLVATQAAYCFGDEWLEQVLAYLEKNLDWFRNYINSHTNAYVFPNQSTYLAWIDCRKWGMDDVQLNKFYREDAGIYCNLGSRFGEEGAGFVRLNLAVPLSIVKEAAYRIERTRLSYLNK